MIESQKNQIKDSSYQFNWDGSRFLQCIKDGPRGLNFICCRGAVGRARPALQNASYAMERWSDVWTWRPLGMDFWWSVVADWFSWRRCLAWPFQVSPFVWVLLCQRAPTQRHDDDVVMDAVVVLLLSPVVVAVVVVVVVPACYLDAVDDDGPLGPALKWMVNDRNVVSSSVLDWFASTADCYRTPNCCSSCCSHRRSWECWPHQCQRLVPVVEVAYSFQHTVNSYDTSVFTNYASLVWEKHHILI